VIKNGQSSKEWYTLELGNWFLEISPKYQPDSKGNFNYQGEIKKFILSQTVFDWPKILGNQYLWGIRKAFRVSASPDSSKYLLVEAIRENLYSPNGTWQAEPKPFIQLYYYIESNGGIYLKDYILSGQTIRGSI
jgi:hypothetical protein